MSGTGGFGTGFPYAPFVDELGNITPVWRNFLVALYKRTGSEAGSNPANAASHAQLVAEQAARIAGDAALGVALQAETAARIAADEQEAAIRAAMDDWQNTTSGWQAALATETAARAAADTAETAARIAGDQWTAGPVHALGTGLALAAGVLSATGGGGSGGGVMLLVNGDIPVGVICDPDGVPVYVPV